MLLMPSWPQSLLPQPVRTGHLGAGWLGWKALARTTSANREDPRRSSAPQVWWIASPEHVGHLLAMLLAQAGQVIQAFWMLIPQR